MTAVCKSYLYITATGIYLFFWACWMGLLVNIPHHYALFPSLFLYSFLSEDTIPASSFKKSGADQGLPNVLHLNSTHLSIIKPKYSSSGNFAWSPHMELTSPSLEPSWHLVSFLNCWLSLLPFSLLPFLVQRLEEPLPQKKCTLSWYLIFIYQS